VVKSIRSRGREVFGMVTAYLLELAIWVREGVAAGNDEPWRDGGRWMVWRFEELTTVTMR